jgi:uncharacterized protein YqeY
LRDKENAQAAVLEEYAAGIDSIPKDEIATTVARIVGELRTNGQDTSAGSVMKALVGPNGAFEGKPVEKAEVARIVKGML